MGVNRFTGLTKQEFIETYLSSYAANPNLEAIVAEDTPSVGYYVDWVSYGAVSPIKD